MAIIHDRPWNLPDRQNFQPRGSGSHVPFPKRSGLHTLFFTKPAATHTGAPNIHQQSRNHTIHHGFMYDVVCFPFKILGAVIDLLVVVGCCPCRTCCGCPATISEARAGATAAAPTDVV